jgi:dipeptidyl aminopeptidase/acylaminoacyl peptidase
LKWSDLLVSDLEKLEKDVTYFTYPNADHNLMPGGWELAVQRSLSFFKEKL